MANEIEEFLAELSEAELDQADQIEKAVIAAFAEGWSEKTAATFVHAAMQIREIVPDMQIPNVVDSALREGILVVLESVRGADINAPRRPLRKRRNGKSKLSGAGV